MKTLMMTAAALALSTPVFAQTTAPMTDDAMPAQTTPAETMPADTMPADAMATDSVMERAQVELTAENPGISADWLENRNIYTTNQPSTTAWDDNATWGATIPDDWNQIGEVDDVILSAEGEVIGYTADIGGFLGLGQRTVLLSPDVLTLVNFDDDAVWGDSTVFATNYTQEELEALPEFDEDLIVD